jgi:hypothetical protein
MLCRFSVGRIRLRHDLSSDIYIYAFPVQQYITEISQEVGDFQVDVSGGGLGHCPHAGIGAASVH